MSSDKTPPVHEMKFNPKDVTCGFGKPMTYEEMMEDKKNRGGGQVQPVDMNQLMKNMANMTEKDGITPEMKKQMSDMLKAKGGQQKKDRPVFGPEPPPEKPKTVVGRDGTVYNLEAMKARRSKK